MSTPLAKAQVKARNIANRAFYFVAGLAVLLVAAGLYASRVAFSTSMGKPPPVLGSIKGFSGTERSGKAITEKDLSGSVWVAGFIFTRCSGPCPRVSGTMASLHRDPLLPGLRLVTFTVDPSFDDTTILTEYAENFGADQRWWFVTAPRDQMYAQIRKNFTLATSDEAPEGTPVGESVSHSTRLVLVDQDGKIRGFFDSQEDATVRELRRAAARLLRENQPEKKG